MTTPIGDASVLGRGAALEQRVERLTSGASQLATPPQTASSPRRERVRATLFGSLMAFGFLLILLGWLGASRTVLVTEQVPYLISGGLLGLGFTVAGGFGYFSHWTSVSRREAAEAEARAEQRHTELLAALERLAVSPVGGGEDDGSAARARRQRPLRRTARGSGG